MSYLCNSLGVKVQAILLAGCFCFGVTGSALAAGWYNMPTSFMQCIGYGYGPGYHSPMILGPRFAAGNEAKRIVYVPKAPVSLPAGNGYCQSGCIDSTVGTTYNAVPHAGAIHFGHDTVDSGSYAPNQVMPSMGAREYQAPVINPVTQPVLAPPTLSPAMNSAGYSNAPQNSREARNPNSTRGSLPWHR